MQTAIVLIQLGTPDEPSPQAVGRFLREFLSDPYVVNLPWPVRKLLVNAVIVPFRRHKSAHAYQAIWTAHGSPLRYHSEQLAHQLQQALGNTGTVKLAMRYGTPSIAQVLSELDKNAFQRIVVLPLFPQYAAATTATALNEVMQHYRGKQRIPSLHMIHDFYDHPHFIKAWAHRIDSHLQNHNIDHILFSFHGLPVRQVQANCQEHAACDMQGACPTIHRNNRFCYRAQCYTTTRAITAALKQNHSHSVAFQSRLGRIPWIQPYLEDHLHLLYKQGIRKLAIASPAFVADCLETLEELAIRTAATWRNMGGDTCTLVPSLNSEPEWVEAIMAMIGQRHAQATNT